MFLKHRLLPVTLILTCLLTGCANPHFFPRLGPLFPGLTETQIPSANRNALAKAKEDFLLVKHGNAPQYARLVESGPHGRSKVYQGDGYRLTMVKEDTIYPHRTGPEIVVSSGITGGKAYHYDEVDEVVE